MIQTVSKPVEAIIADTLFIPIFEDKESYNIEIIKKIIKEANSHEVFTGKREDKLTLHRLPHLSVKRVTFLGLGAEKSVTIETYRKLAGACVQDSIKSNCSEIAFAVPFFSSELDRLDILEALMEGAYLGNHIHDAFKTESKKKSVSSILFHLSGIPEERTKPIVQKVIQICTSSLLAREWVNRPSNEKTPSILSELITSEAKKVDLDVKKLGESDLIEHKFGAMLSVAKGSENAPNLTILEYTPKEYSKTILLVGKGVTFDSGGLSLKASASQVEMKSDMAGAAAVAAALIAIGKIKPKTKVIGILPLVENMPSGRATRPGDIVTTYRGKTVEIQNTDAEGRLILADAISYGIKTYHPDTVIDVATLTGACVIALGEKIAALFSDNEELKESLLKSSDKTDERLWPMPMPEDYRDYLKSDFADICNISSSKYGGAITAALFLKEFAEKTDWAHIDIAGPSYSKSGSEYCPPGGSGFGVRLLVNFIEHQ